MAHAKVPEELKTKLKDIKVFVNDQRSSSLKMAFIVSLPFVVFFTSVLIVSVMINGTKINADHPMFIGSLIIFFFWMGGSVLYASVMRELFFAKKLLKIDVFCTGRTDGIEDNDVTKKAWQAIFPINKMRFLLFLQYYIWIYVYYVGCIYFYFHYFFMYPDNAFLIAIFWPIMIQMILGPLLFWLHYRFIDRRLRFFWAIFIKKYNQDHKTTYRSLRREMLIINAYMTNDQFKQLLNEQFSVEDLDVVMNDINRIAHTYMGSKRIASRSLGASASFINEEYNNQINETVKLVTSYTIYDYILKNCITKKGEDA